MFSFKKWSRNVFWASAMEFNPMMMLKNHGQYQWCVMRLTTPDISQIYKQKPYRAAYSPLDWQQFKVCCLKFHLNIFFLWFTNCGFEKSTKIVIDLLLLINEVCVWRDTWITCFLEVSILLLQFKSSILKIMLNNKE